MGRKVADRAGAARQGVQRPGHVGGDLAGIKIVMADHTDDVIVLDLQYLRHPMDNLDIGIATHLAKDGCPLDGLVSKAVQLPEQGDSADLGHDVSLPSGSCGAAPAANSA